MVASRARSPGAGKWGGEVRGDATGDPGCRFKWRWWEVPRGIVSHHSSDMEQAANRDAFNAAVLAELSSSPGPLRLEEPRSRLGR